MEKMIRLFVYFAARADVSGEGEHRWFIAATSGRCGNMYGYLMIILRIGCCSMVAQGYTLLL